MGKMVSNIQKNAPQIAEYFFIREGLFYFRDFIACLFDSGYNG